MGGDVESGGEGVRMFCMVCGGGVIVVLVILCLFVLCCVLFVVGVNVSLIVVCVWSWGMCCVWGCVM